MSAGVPSTGASSRRRAAMAATLVVGAVPSLWLGWTLWVGQARGVLTLGGHMPVVRDYVWLWGASTLLAAGDVATIFDPHAFAGWLRAALGPTLDDFVWSYPPPMLFLAWPARLLPLVEGLLAYEAAQLGLLMAVGRAAGLRWAPLLAVAVSPAVLENGLAGQNGALTAALLGGGLLLAERRPILSGVLLGALCVKPQAGLLVPVCLLASRNGRAAAAAAATICGLVLASLAAFGPGSFVAFWTQTRPWMTAVLQADWQGLLYQRLMVTGFMGARSAGAGLAASAAIQALLTAGAAACAWRLWRAPGPDAMPSAAGDAMPRAAGDKIRRAGNTIRRAGATLCLGPLATPYGYTYDMVGVALAVAMLAAGRPPLWDWRATALASAWLWPGLALAASLAGLPDAGVLAILAAAAAAL